MFRDGAVVAVVPVLVIRMLTTDNQRCAAALECYQEAPELRVQGAGRDVVLKEVRLTLDEARVCTLLLNNVGNKLCLDLKLHGAFHAAAHGGGREREIPARARRREGYVLTAPRRSASWRDRDLASNFSAGVQHAVTLRR
jgi:hypothetical protein